MTPRTIRDAMEAADAARFVGRDAELSAAVELLDDATPSRVLYVHGPGGIGKSTLVRAIARIARENGFTISSIDTHAGSVDVEEHVFALNADHPERYLIVIDEADLVGSKLETMRDRLLDGLGDSSRIVFAGRNPPAPSWRADGRDAIVVDLALRILDDEIATQLLTAHGVTNSQINEIVRWANGSPLALTVAALSPETAVGRPDVSELEARLTTWISGQTALNIASDLLEVAAIAPVVDARLIAAALPRRNTREAMTDLRALAVVERSGDRAILHRVLASAIRQRLQYLSPERYRLLTRRIVEHLGSRARLGDISALIELSQFVTDPALSQAISNRPSPSLFTDRSLEGEFADFARANGFDQEPDWNEIAAIEAEHTPYHVVVRAADGTPVLFGAFARADRLSSVGPVSTSLNASVATSGIDRARSFVGVVLFADVAPELIADAARLGSGALMHRHGMPDMQGVFIHYPAPDRRPDAIVDLLADRMRAQGGREVLVSDFRPDGAVGFVEAAVLADLGFPPRSIQHADLLAFDDDPDRHAQLRAILDLVFGETEKDQRLRQVIELAHMGPKCATETYAEALHVSRRTWFRLLREARERILAFDPEVGTDVTLTAYE